MAPAPHPRASKAAVGLALPLSGPGWVSIAHVCFSASLLASGSKSIGLWKAGA